MKSLIIFRDRFAKSTMTAEDVDQLINLDYTEMGNCMEINDNQMLVQRSVGATGGFSITLDTSVAHYTDDTVSCISINYCP